jgi:hypothetical protein
VVAGPTELVLGDAGGTVTVRVGVTGLELWVPPQAARVTARRTVAASLGLITKA